MALGSSLHSVPGSHTTTPVVLVFEKHIYWPFPLCCITGFIVKVRASEI